VSRTLALLLLCGAVFGEEHAFVEITAARGSCFEREAIRVKLRFGFDRDFFAAHAVPLFLREMDVPVQVGAPREVKGLVPLADPPDDRPRRTFALGEEVVAAAVAGEELRDGRAFTVLELERRYQCGRAGTIDIPAPTLRYRHAARFEEDFVTGRVAVDPQDTVVRGAPLALRALPLPEEGRPPGFTGAVGRFAVRAEADRTSVDAGAILRLTLRIEGEGNLEALPPPRLDALQGFHVYGALEERGARGRTVAYDVAPLSAAVTEVPSIPFAFFDPGPPAGYRIARTDPIPLDVRGPAAPAARKWGGTALLVGAVLATAAGAAWLRRRARRAAPVDPRALRVARARSALARDGDRAEAFAELLAAHLDCPAAAVIGPDLARRLEAAGIPAALAARVAATLERLVEVRYGGAAADADVEALARERAGALRAR
jgi:hypothetical protein